MRYGHHPIIFLPLSILFLLFSTLTSHGASREYFCSATDAVLLDFLNDPQKPLYMQRMSTNNLNIKLSRGANKIVIKDNRGLETSYPIVNLGYKLTYVKDFFVAIDGRAYFEFRDGEAVLSHPNLITSYKYEKF